MDFKDKDSRDFKPRWIQEFEKLIRRRQHIILYGNIRDHFLWRGNYQSIQEFLNSYFLDLKFDLVVSYDPIKKFEFARSDMNQVFDKLALRHGGIETDQSIEEEFLKTLGLLSQSEKSVAVTSEKSVAVTVDLGDMLASESIDSSSGERHPLIMLKKCTLEAELIADGALKGYRNTLVILANELETVPQWFYRNNPFVSILQVPLPKKEERREFAMRFIRPIHGRERSGFYQGDRIQPDEELKTLAEEFADLTEGFKNWDLETLRHTSWQAEIPLQANKIWQLVDFYKFGERNDPWEQLNKERLETASDELSKGVIGQESAIEAVTTMLSSARVGLSMSTKAGRSGKPKGVFFFVGSTGVGKTELAKAMTKLVFGNEEAFARFDMSEYREENADQKLIGAPPGFVGYESGGQLTNRVIEQPYSILLFDEIEKANPKILDKFLQILEDGRLTDSKGQTAYFNQTAIIFTSNIGASDQTDHHGNIIRPGIMNQVKEADGFTYEQVKEHFQGEVQWHFASRIGRTELLGRLGDNIVVFDLLRPEFVRAIGEKFLRQLKEAALDKYRLNLEFQESIFEVLSQKMAEKDNLLMGGRGVKTVLETLVERPLNRWIFEEFSKDMSQLAGMTLEVGITSNKQLEVHQI
jgi:ATPases with chaperone activity, ATP-binding subunit